MLVYLEVTTWRGMSIGAIHYYGRLRVGDKTIDVMRKVTAAAVKELNRRDGGGYDWQVGEETSRWNSKLALERAAIRWFKANYSIEDSMLIKGLSGIFEPQPVICGKEPFKSAINQLHSRAEECGFWHNENVMQDICDEWEVVIKPFRGESRKRKPRRPSRHSAVRWIV
jgi:hypothetical protein